MVSIKPDSSRRSVGGDVKWDNCGYFCHTWWWARIHYRRTGQESVTGWPAATVGQSERMGVCWWCLIDQSVGRGLDWRHFTSGAISNRYSPSSLLLPPVTTLAENRSPTQTTCRCRTRSAIVPCGSAAAVVSRWQHDQQSRALARLQQLLAENIYP